MSFKPASILMSLLFAAINLTAQQRDSTITKLSVDKYVQAISNKSGQLQQGLEKANLRILKKFQQQERKIQGRLARIDSLKAKRIFANSEEYYNKLRQKVAAPATLRQYIPALDSLGTSLNFLQQYPQLLAKAPGAQQRLNEALSGVTTLESQFQKAEDIKQFLKERNQYLRGQLGSLGLVKDLKKLNKGLFYYGEKVNELKNTLADRKKIEAKVMELLSKTKIFKEFISRNGFIARLFPLPGTSANNTTQQSGFAGLQTRVQVNSYLQQASMSASSGAPQMQQNIQEAQAGLDQIRSKLDKLGVSGSDLEMPDFKINTRRGKSFFKRLEYGTNFQSQQKRNFFPATSDIGVSVGYKLNDKSTLGVGASYKLGLGTGWNNIKMTHEGVGLRTFIDWKIKGSFWLSGGYERNYKEQFKKIEALKNLNAWQQSGLIGLTKTISLKTKFFKQTRLQLLWDILSYQQVPETQPLLFRIGYNF